MIRGYIAKKIAMAITGMVMLLYLMVHLLGNLMIFKGPSWINAYALTLRETGLLLWSLRVLMLASFLIHVTFAIQLTVKNSKARPIPYRSKKNLGSTLASRNMIWTGLIVALYIPYHIFNFTIPLINPEFSAERNIDPSGRPDVFKMVIMNFTRTTTIVIYTTALIAITLHLFHGIQSLFQTLGLNSEKTLPRIIKAGTIISVIIMIGFLSIPVAILTGLLGVP